MEVFLLLKKIFQIHKKRQNYFRKRPLEKAFKSGQLNAYKHDGFWKCMDTIRDKQVIEEILKRKNYEIVCNWLKWIYRQKFYKKSSKKKL